MPGDQADVRTGNGHQMADAGAVEHLPLPRRDAALLAHRQRGQYPGLRVTGQQAVEGFGYLLAVPIQGIAFGLGQQTGHRMGTDAARGDDASGVQPALMVETARIEQAMRPL